MIVFPDVFTEMAVLLLFYFLDRGRWA